MAPKQRLDIAVECPEIVERPEVAFSEVNARSHRNDAEASAGRIDVICKRDANIDPL